MSIAEEKAMRAYADHKGFTFEDERKAYVKGYNEALKDLWHNPNEEVPDNDRQVIIMVTIYDWFCARWDAETETWRAGRDGDIVFSRGYVHLWLDMQEEFKVR